MREMEFKKLIPGDIIQPLNKPEDPWTVMVWQPRNKTFLLIQGRRQLTRWSKIIWFIMARLPDRECLAMTDSRDIRVARIIDPQNWEMEQKQRCPA